MKRRSAGWLAVAVAFFVFAGGCKKEPPPLPESKRPLVILIGADVTSFDPQIPFDESSIVLDNIFQKLVEFDNTFQLAPGLATRWTNPDDKTWRFYLNPDSYFSDGTKLTAADVKFSIERLKNLTTSDLQGFTEHITTVSVVEDHTVDIKTDIPFSILNNLVFIPILSEKYVNSVGDKAAEMPMGTGPYRLDRWEKDKHISLTANPHYARKVAIQKVDYLINSDPEAVLDTILRIKPDITNALPFRKIEDFQKRKTTDLKIVSANGISVYYIVFSLKPTLPDFTGRNPLADVRVRKALAYSTDINSVVQTLSKGYGRVPTQMVAPEIFGFDPGIPPPVYDVEKAKKMLAEAGYTNLTIPLYSGETGTHRFEKMLIEQWAKSGITGVLKLIPDDDFYPKQSAGDFATSIGGYSCGSGDASELLTFNMHTRSVDQSYGKGNAALYSNPEVDRITEENLRTFNPKERLQLLQKGMRIVTDEAPYFPLVIFDDVYIVSDRINWIPPVTGEVRISDIRFKQ